MTIRIAVTAVLILLAHGGVLLIQQAYVPGRIELPQEPLSSLPMQLGNWIGDDIESDPLMVDATGAHSVVDRVYRSPSDREIFVHLAIFASPQTDELHAPELCYTGAGWTIAGQHTKPIEASGARTATVRVLELEQSGREMVVLYWYQFGPVPFLGRATFRDARRAFFGQETWPPVVKFMVHTPGAHTQTTARSLEEFAEHLYAWSSAYR